MTAAQVVEDLTDTAGFDDDQRGIWNEQKAIYAAFLRADRARIDLRIASDATIWDGVEQSLARGLEDLNAIRARRPRGDDAPLTTRLVVSDAVISVIGDAAIARHILMTESVGAAGSTRQTIRVSAGWQRRGSDWWIIHSHEDVFDVDGKEGAS